MAWNSMQVWFDLLQLIICFHSNANYYDICMVVVVYIIIIYYNNVLVCSKFDDLVSVY